MLCSKRLAKTVSLPWSLRKPTAGQNAINTSITSPSDVQVLSFRLPKQFISLSTVPCCRRSPGSSQCTNLTSPAHDYSIHYAQDDAFRCTQYTPTHGSCTESDDVGVHRAPVGLVVDLEQAGCCDPSTEAKGKCHHIPR